MDVSEINKRNYLDGLRRYEEAQGKTIAEIDAELERKFASQAVSASTASATSVDADARTMKEIIDDYQRKHPNAPKVATEIGPLERHMMGLAAAARRVRRGVGPATAATIGVHKLPRYVVPG